MYSQGKLIEPVAISEKVTSWQVTSFEATLGSEEWDSD